MKPSLEALPVLDEAIRGLIKSRDFLGLQLNHAWGNLSDAEFERESLRYLDPPLPDPALEAKVAQLLVNTTADIDEELVSCIFHCPLEQAIAVFKLLATPHS